MASNFKDLVVWKKAMALVTDVYRLTRSFPDEEKFGLANQLRRAAVSIPSNIAEGQGRRTPKMFQLFLNNARGSLLEVETQLLIAHNLNYIGREELEGIQGNVHEVARLLSGLTRSLAPSSKKR